MDRPEAFQNNILGGLFLFQLMLRLQLNEHPDLDNGVALALSSDIDIDNQKDLDNVVVQTMNMVTDQFGLLQAMRLTRGLFNMNVLRALALQVVENESTIDWAAIGDNIPKLAELYNLNPLFRPYLDTDLNRAAPEMVRKMFLELPQLLQWTHWGGYMSTNSDYTYMLVWLSHFPDWKNLQSEFQSAGCMPNSHVESDPNAVENLMPADPALFEAFCYLHSLTKDQAKMWEDMVVGWGYDSRKGSVERAMRITSPPAADIFTAGALAAGFPIHDRETAMSDYADLVMRIEGFINYSERERVHDIISNIAPLLYLELTNADAGRYKSQSWRGIRLTANYEIAMQYVDDYASVDLLPLIKLRVTKHANRDFAIAWREGHVIDGSRSFSDGPSEVEEWLAEGREVAMRHCNLRPSANRLIYLVDQLCQIIHDDFDRLGYFS